MLHRVLLEWSVVIRLLVGGGHSRPTATGRQGTPTTRRRDSGVGVLCWILLCWAVLATAAPAQGMGGSGGFQSGVPSGGIQSGLGGLQSGASHPAFQASGAPPDGPPGTAPPPHFPRELFFGPLVVPGGLQVVVIGAPGASSPSVPPCGPETHWAAALGRCQQNRSLAAAPPSGVMVLRPEGRQELATACPQQFIEQVVKVWRFCLDPQHLEPVSPLNAPPIAGIPYEEALQILQRHKEALLTQPGVKVVGLERGGLYVEAEQPAGLPAAVEGLPLVVHPWQPRNLE